MQDLALGQKSEKPLGEKGLRREVAN